MQHGPEDARVACPDGIRTGAVYVMNGMCFWTWKSVQKRLEKPPIPGLDCLRKRILDNQNYFARLDISATRFGRRAVRDIRFLLDLRMERRLRRQTVEKVSKYLFLHDTKE